MSRKNTKLSLLIFVVICSVIFSGSVSAVPTDDPDMGDMVGYSDETGMVTFIGSNSQAGIQVDAAAVEGMLPVDRASALLAEYAPLFSESNPTQNLQQMYAMQPRRGQETYRYQQYYQGVPIMAAEVILNMTSQGGMLSMSGELSPNLELSATPTISADNALQQVYDLFALSYQVGADEIIIYGPELWIFDERLLAPSDRPAELVWRIEAGLADRPVNELVLVSAETGGISLHFNQIDTSWTGSSVGTVEIDQNLLVPDALAKIEIALRFAPHYLIDYDYLLEDAYAVVDAARALSEPENEPTQDDGNLSVPESPSLETDPTTWYVNQDTHEKGQT